MKKLLIAVFAMLTVIAGICQSGDLQTRKVPGFHGVSVSGGIDLYLSSGPESVSLGASSTEIRDHIVTEVIGGVLRIHLEDNWYHGWGSPKMKAHVSVSDLQSLDASGGGDIFMQNQISAGDLKVALSGGSDLKGKLNASHLIINQSGGSDVDISGNVKKLDVESSGGSEMGGYGLVVDYVNLRASGGSDTELTVNKELNIVVSGGSDVHYKGSATVKEIKTSGSSSVTHKD